MVFRSNLQHAINELSTREQVPLSAERFPLHRLPSNDLDGPADINFRLGVPLVVSVTSGSDGVLIRGDLEKIDWSTYEAISVGVRKIVAAILGLDFEALLLNKLLVVCKNQVTQFFEVVIPPEHVDAVRSHTQQHVDTYLKVVKGTPVPDEPEQPLEAQRAGVSGDEACQHALDMKRFHTTAINIAREVRAAVGGKTLPAACTVEASGWSSPIELSGKLGEKIKAPRSEPVERVIECYVDGYLKSQRHVYLLPVCSSSDEQAGAKREGRKIVAFDEERWLPLVAEAASKRGLLMRATYSFVIDGSKQLLQLLDLAPVSVRGETVSSSSTS